MKKIILAISILAIASIVFCDENANIRDIKNLRLQKLDKSAVVMSLAFPNHSTVPSTSAISSANAKFPNMTSVVPYSGAIKNVNLNNKQLTVDQINLNLSPTSTPVQGSMFWNPSDQTVSIQNDANTTLDIGHENYIRVVNKTGVQINDGQVVFIRGAQGNRPKAQLAIATNYSSSRVIGVATENIPDNQEGSITTFGVVHGYNTSSFQDGAALYLSPISAGVLTTTQPATPYYNAMVAIALNSTVNGAIFVSPQPSLSTDISLSSDNATNATAPSQLAVKTKFGSQSTAFQSKISSIQTTFTSYTTGGRVSYMDSLGLMQAHGGAMSMIASHTQLTGKSAHGLASVFTGMSSSMYGHINSVTPYGGHPAAGSNKQIQYSNNGTPSGAVQLNYSSGMTRIGNASKTPASMLTVISDLASSTVNYIARLINNVTTQFAQAVLSFDFNSGTVASINAIQNSAGRNSALTFSNMTGGVLREAARITNYKFIVGGVPNPMLAPTAFLHVFNPTISDPAYGNTELAVENRVDDINSSGSVSFYKGKGVNSTTFRNISSSQILAQFLVAGANNTNTYDGARGFLRVTSNEKFTASTGSFDILFRNRPTGTLAMSDRMIIKGNGKVGIGTTAPRATFDNASSSAGRGRAYNGSATNYVLQDQGLGTRYQGNAQGYLDVEFPMSPPKATGAGNPTLVAFGENAGLKGYSFAVNDQHWFDPREYPHSGVIGAPIVWHIHWDNQTNVAATRGVKWELTRTCCLPNGVCPAATVSSVDVTVPANTAVGTQLLTDIVTDTYANIGPATICIPSIKRIASAGTAPATDPIVLGVHYHYKVDSPGGSDGIYTKTASP